MSSFDKLFAKGKAKVKELQAQHLGGQSQHQATSQGYPGQQAPQGYSQQPQPGYNQQQQPQQQPWQYSGAQYPPSNQQQQWGPPSNQWQPPPQQQQQQQQQQHQGFAPPIPQNKPHSPAPPIPQNRPTAAQPPPPQNIPPPYSEKVYWKPAFDAATPVSTNFRHELGDHGWGNDEKQNYTDSPANSFHHDNRLVVRGLVQNGSYTSARLTSHQTLSRPRGYIEATTLPPSAPGIWPAYWMLPCEPFNWPGDGEVDIMENWNDEKTNHSCLHWGHYSGEDAQKHRVVQTPLPDLTTRPHAYGFAWIEEEGIPDWRGRLIWYIDGRPVMRGSIPAGSRRMEDYRILINIAMGGTCNKGQLPSDGYYDLVVSDLKMCEEPVGGWQAFEQAWNATAEGKVM
jgi:hypothetical protein